MKRYIRALGVDDSYFVPHEPGSTSLIGVLMRAPNYFEGMLIRKIQVDGLDSTEAILDMLSSKYGRQVRVLFTQGITFGGFNIVDIRRIWEETNVPIIVVSRKEPDMGKIENALKKHFEDWKKLIAKRSKFFQKDSAIRGSEHAEYLKAQDEYEKERIGGLLLGSREGLPPSAE